MLPNTLKYSLIAAVLAAGCTSKEKPIAAATVPAAPEAVKRTAYQAEVHFEFERAEPDAESRKLLDDLAQKLVAGEIEKVNATAHADRIGGAAYNERLSARRAEAIRVYLAGKGVPEKRLHVEARGAREPVAHCEAMGPENKQNAKLIACLQPDRRALIRE